MKYLLKLQALPAFKLFKVCRPVSQMSSVEIIPLPEVRRFVVDCMVKVGTSSSHAEQLAELLVAADHRGHFSHGLNRLEMYINDVKSGICDANAKPIVLKENIATAWVDGCNSLGPVVGKFCMDLAIQKAKHAGVGWVVAKGSNHYGIAGWYAMQAMESGLMGMSFTNTSPLMSPTRSKQAALGTNPLSLAAPAQDGDSVVLDMATTSVALGKIEVQKRKNEPIPKGWAQDREGRPTTNADIGYATQCLMPLGGSEENSGYKGYGLALMVEMFCGILSGSAYGPNVRRWMNTEKVANLGQCFVAIDQNCFAPGFEGRLQDLLNSLRGMEPADSEKPVLIPGDLEAKNIASADKVGGIQYHPNQLKASKELALSLNVVPMKSKNS